MIKKYFGLILFFLFLSVFSSAVLYADRYIDEDTIISCFPEKYCSIKKVHNNPDSNKWIIYVQDAHTNYDAQMNINNILKSLSNKNCLDIVLIEGASDLIDTSPIKKYPHAKSKETVSEYLLQTAIITGFEYFSIQSGLDTELVGVEDPATYEKNLDSLRNGMELFQKNSAVLDKISSFLDIQKTTIKSPELRKFVEIRKLYSGNIVDVKEYCLELADRIAFDKRKYPNIFNIKNIKKLNENINYSHLEREIQESIKYLFTVLEKDKIVEFNQLNLKHKIGSITARSFYNQVIKLLKETRRDPGLFSTLENYTNLLNLYSQLDHTQLILEIDLIENEFIENYAVTPREKAIFELESKTEVLSEILSFKISREKANIFFSDRDEYTAGNFFNLVNTICEKDNELLLSDINKLITNLNSVIQFYELALERDRIMVDNSINKLEENNMSVGVLIAGGFHTQGILENLEKSNLNYVFLTPAINHISKKNIYISRILKLNSPLDTFFENALNSLAIPRWLAKIPIGLSLSDQQVQILKSVSLLLTVHTDFIALETPGAAAKNILDKINAAIMNYDSRGIEVKNIKLFPNYRVYEVSINGSSLFYCFKNRQDKSLLQVSDLIIDDIQTIIARNIAIGDSDLSILTEDTLSPVLSGMTISSSGFEQFDDNAVINWAKENTPVSEQLDDSLIEINALPQSIITLSQQGNYYHIAHVRFTGDERVTETLYHDKIHAASIKPEYLWHLIQVLQESLRQDISLLPQIVISNKDYTAIVSLNSKSEFLGQVGLLINKDQSDDSSKNAVSSQSPGTEDPLKLNYVKFTTAIEDDESVGDEEIIEKLKLFVRDEGPEERLNHIAQTSPNLRVLNLLAEERFYDRAGINKASDEELYVLKGLLGNHLITKEVLDKILQRSYFFMLSFLEKGDISKTDFIEMLISHNSITPEQLNQLAKSLIELKKAVLNDSYEQYEKYWFRDDYKGMVAIWENRKEGNLNRINKYLESIVSSPQTDIQTTRMIKDSLEDHRRDANVYFSIARYSNNPEIVYEELKNDTYPSHLNMLLHYLQLALAENPNIDVNILDYLIETKDPEIILSLVDTLLNKELTNVSDDWLLEAIFEIIDITPVPVHAIKTIAESKVYLSEKLYDKLLEKNIPDPESDDFSEQQKIHILKSLASNHNLTFTHMHKLHDLKNIDILMSLFSNPYMKFSYIRAEVTLGILEQMKGETYSINTFVAMTQNLDTLPKEIEKFLRESDSFIVRAALASRFNISQETIEILADDPHPFVRGMIANNPAVPVYILEKFYEEYDDEPVLNQPSVSEILKLSLSVFPEKYILDILKKSNKILDLLSLNSAIIGSPLKIVKPMMNDSRFSQNVMATLEHAKRKAVKDYQAKNYVQAFNRLGLLVLHHDYAPFGSTFIYGNIAYRLSKDQQEDSNRQKLFNLAKDSYEMSFNKLNNINSFIALEYLKRTGDIPDVVLDAPNHVQFILQNFHSAQTLTAESFEIINRFLNFSWDGFDYSSETATILALITHVLYDSVTEGFISSETGLSILTQFLYKDFSSFSPDKWENIKSDIISQIITRSNLDRSKQAELLEAPLDLAEFYLRKGHRGIVNHKSYESFQKSLLLDNIPPYLRDDVTKSVWLELNGLTQDLLFVEPHFFTLVRLITDNGDFLLSADRLRFSMNFSETELHDGIGDINLVIKSELGHAISFGTSLDYDHYVRNSAFEEFQDRSACLKFPSELNDAGQAKKITELYTQHDNLLIELYAEALKQIDPFIIMEKLDELDLFDINHDYFVRNGKAVIDKLLARSLTKLDERFLGEAIYLLAANNKTLFAQNKIIQDLFPKIKELKQEKRKLPWDVRVFFEGGIYLQTYYQPFGQVMPPIDLVAGELETGKLESAEIHFTGEWLNYLFRMRVRELLRSGLLEPSMLPAFYRSAPIFLNSYIYTSAKTINIRHIANTIQNLTPKDVFTPIEKRLIEQKIIPSRLSQDQSADSIKQSFTQTAEPAKVVLKLVGQSLQRLYSANLITFSQFAAIYAKYFNEVYELHKNRAVVDLNAKTQFTKKFVEHLFLSLADVDIDLNEIAVSLFARAETQDAILAFDPNKEDEPSEIETFDLLSVIESEKISPLIQSTVSNLERLRKKMIVVDFDALLNSDNAAVQAEMLNALKYNLILQHNDIKTNLKLMFFSRIKSNDQIRSILQEYFSAEDLNRFKIFSEQELEKHRITVTKYIETTYSIAKQNILFLTSGMSALNDQFLANGSISFEIPQNTTNWFANVFKIFSLAFDFAENERLPKTMNIAKVMPINPNYYYFSFPQQTPFTLNQFYSESDTNVLSIADLSGISLVLPANEQEQQPTVLRKNIFGYDLIEQAL